MTLSVLVCTIPERFFPLRGYLNDPRIEFLYLGDNMKLSLGKKRQLLLEIASGDYVVFVDDDDELSSDYIDQLLEGIKSGADVVNFKVGYSLNGGEEKPVVYSKNFKKDNNFTDRFERLPNHIMCIKRSIALKVGYKDMYYAEDADFSKRLLPHLKTEHNIDKILYRYLDNAKTTTSRRNISRR